MFDRRLINLSNKDPSTSVQGQSPWQPLTNESGDLVERVSSGESPEIFGNAEVSKLITELKVKYEEQEQTMLSSSSDGSNKVTSPKRKSNEVKVHQRSSFSAGREGVEGYGNQRQERNWIKSKLKVKLGDRNSFEETRMSPEVKEGGVRNSDSNSEVLNEHQESMYADLLGSVMAEIEDNQSFLDSQESEKNKSKQLHRRGTRPAHSRTPLGKTSSCNTGVGASAAGTSGGGLSFTNHHQMHQGSISATTPKSPKRINSNAFNYSSPSQLSAMRGCAKKSLQSDSVHKNYYLNDRVVEVENDDFGRRREHRFPSLNLDDDCGEGDGDVEEEEEGGDCCDVIGHPTVQALLSEEKGRRWELLKSLYEREACLERQIQDLQLQLKHQTTLANHFKRMQQELVTSQTEKENLWEKERRKLIEKLKSGHDKMKLCSKLIVILQKENKQKEHQINELLSRETSQDENKNDVYKYDVLGEEPIRSELDIHVSSSSSLEGSPKNSIGQLKAAIISGQSELSIESNALIGYEEFDSELPSFNNIDPQGNERSAATIRQFWNGNGIVSEMSQVRKLVNNCKLNAEKQCRILRQIFPEASKNCSKQFSSKLKTFNTATERSFTFDDAKYESQDDEDTEDENNDSEDNENEESSTVRNQKCMFKSKSVCLGMSQCSEFIPAANCLSSHMSSSVSAISATCANLDPHSIQTGDTPSGDPFDLDLKVKYCSSENLPHAIQCCSLTSPLISPCSSFDDGLSSNNRSKPSSVFGSSVIISKPSNALPSPTRSLGLTKQSSVSSCDNNDLVWMASRVVGSPGGSGSNGGAGTDLNRNESRSGYFSMSLSDNHSTEHETNASGSTGREDSLMLFDTTPGNTNTAASLIKDFDPLDA